MSPLYYTYKDIVPVIIILWNKQTHSVPILWNEQNLNSKSRDIVALKGLSGKKLSGVKVVSIDRSRFNESLHTSFTHFIVT
jgi:hypothetical protein